MPEKLKSRKLAAFVVTVIINVMGRKLDLTTAELLNITGLASAYLIGQGYVDGQAAKTLKT